jgi:putative ABC transport system substrate-binding protein
VYRSDFAAFVAEQKALAAKEQVEIVGINLDRSPSESSIEAALRTLRVDHHIDAIWVLNDNGLLKDPEFRGRAWRSELAAMGVPVIVGAANLVNASSPFGTFAVLPDHNALGVQAANLVFDLADDDWKAAEHDTEYPLSTITVVDGNQVRTRFGLRADAHTRIDRFVE